jgi:phenylpropionate dioxygenase-like ring-hydroxylating dioxygenase large terminal subunit
MLSAEDTELISRVGPGTMMGNLMREYWVPALLSSELPKPDCDPVRIMLLGEQLIAFRDSAGRVGLLPHQCPHRGASLFFGRNEEGGLRCVYHGWKFGVDGSCLDMPNEPPASNFKDKVCAKAYPCVEAGDMVWTYMGTRETLPPLPAFEIFDYPPEERITRAYFVDCNYLQVSEGDRDPTHFQFLHAGHAKPAESEGLGTKLLLQQKHAHYKMLDTPAGVMFGMESPLSDDETLWTITNWLFPFHTITGGAFGGKASAGLGVVKKASILTRVPMDDEHTMTFLSTCGLEAPMQEKGARKRITVPFNEYANLPLKPNTTDWYGRFRWHQELANDYLIDRAKQRNRESFTGIDGVIIEDIMVNESMGPNFDRTKERLGASDIWVIRVRRRMLDAARALAENGTPPPGVDEPTAFRVRSGQGMILPTDGDWLEAARMLRRGWDGVPNIDDAETDATLFAAASS